MRCFLPLIGCIAGLTGCGPVNYETLTRGDFHGSLIVMWVGEGDGLGSGEFVFVPAPGDPLIFTRRAPNATVKKIQPGVMYTDGGSIPKAGQVFKGFSPWGYAPAYMIHDWLFVARHCILDQDATSEHALMAPVAFEESADILGESIKTLIDERQVSPDDFAPGTITSVVKGPISRNIWNKSGECEKQKVTKAHLDQVARAFPQESRATMREVTDEAIVEPSSPGPRAKIVATISFGD